MGNYFKKLSLLLILLIFNTISAQGLLGVTIADTAFVYSEQDENSSIIDTIYFGEFAVSTDQYFFGSNGEFVGINQDNKFGWVKWGYMLFTNYFCVNVKEGTKFLDYALQETNDVAEKDLYGYNHFFQFKNDNFYVNLQLLNTDKYNSYTSVFFDSVQVNQETILSDLFKKFSGEETSFYYADPSLDFTMLDKIFVKLNRLDTENFLFFEKFEQRPRYDIVSKNVYLEYLKSKIKILQEDYSGAIKILENVIEKYPAERIFGGKAAPWAYLRIAEIYSDYLNDTNKSIEFYNIIIRDYVGEYSEVKYYLNGSNSFLNYKEYSREAAHRIFNLIKDDENLLHQQSNVLINNYDDLVIKMIGYYGLLNYQTSILNDDDLINFQLEILNKLNFSEDNQSLAIEYYFSFAEYLFDFFERNNDFENYFKLAELFQGNDSNELKDLGLIKEIQLKDKTDFPKDEVTDLLTENSIKLYGDLSYRWDYFNNDRLLNYFPYWRYQAIKKVPSQTVVVKIDTELKKGCENFTETVKYLSKGEQLNLIYYNDYLYYYETKKIVKVNSIDGTIGWIPEEYIEYKTMQIFDSKKESEVWDHQYANSRNNPYFAGPEIHNIQLEQLIKGYGAYPTTIFGYYDDDNILDMVGYVDYQYSRLVSGKTHERIYDLEERFSYPDKFYISKNKIVTQKYILDTKNNLKLWEKSGNISNRPYVYEDNLFTVCNDTLFRVNINDGSIIWKKYCKIDNNYFSVAAVDKDFVLLKSDRTLSCHNRSNGSYLWDQNFNSLGDQIVLDKDKIFLSYLENSSNTISVVSIHSNSGELNWKTPIEELYHWRQSLSVDESSVYFSDRVVASIDKNNGLIKWIRDENESYNSVIIVNNSLYLNTESPISTFYSLDKYTGDVNWTYETKMQAHGAKLCYQSGKLFYHSDNGTLVFRDSTANGLPGGYKNKTLILPNYPNPFNSSTTVQFEIREEAEVQVLIVNSLGQKIKTIKNCLLPIGKYEFHWDGKNDFNSNVASGVYYVVVVTDKYVKGKGMILLK